MSQAALFEKLLQQSFRFLSYRPRSLKEIEEYLNKRANKIAPDQGKILVLKIIKQLENEGLIDDREFVIWWVRQRQDFRPKSQRVMALELKRLGIEDDLIEEVFEQEKSKFKGDEIMAEELLRKWLKKHQSLPAKDLKKKYLAYLFRRGFKWQDIQIAIDKVFSESVH